MSDDAPPRDGARRRTSSGFELDAFYRPRGDEVERYRDRLGDPGQAPFTRGLYGEMYRHRLWTMRQYAGYGDAEESNRRYRYLLDQGITGLSVAFDLPTQIGLDSDHPMARGEVGKVGVSIDSIEDMRRLLEGIPLDRVTTSMTINSTATTLLALYLVVAEERGIDWRTLGGTVQNDILKEYAARGTYIYPPRPSLDLVVDLMAFCAERVPRWNPISVSGYHMREAGCTAVQEVAFTLANALTYVDAALARGLDLDAFAPRLSFFFNAHNHFLEEVSKFRAARRLWAELVSERYHPRNERSLWLRFHTQTAGSTLTARQTENNVVRVAVQALAAVCGGTQSLHTNASDEALGLPTERSAGVALRTQQILALESGIADVADPLGGSWAIEALTDQIAAEARRYIERIDAMGGALAAIERGFVQEEIAEAAFAAQMAIERGKAAVVGVNVHRSPEEVPAAGVLKVDPALERRQVARLEQLRSRRDAGRAGAALAALEAAAGETSLLPPILDCVRAECTVGEISDALRRAFGEHRETQFL